MIQDEARARALARKLVKSVWLFAGDQRPGPDSPQIADARRLYRGKVAPELHPLFEAELAAGPTEDPISPETRRRAGRWLTGLFVVLFLGFFAGTAWCAHHYFIAPGRAEHDAHLESWVGELRAGRAAPPTSPGPTTDAALRALAASTAYRILDTKGGYGATSGTTCYDLDVIGASGSTPIVVRMTDHDGPLAVTGAGLRPPCECSRNGRLVRCD